MYFIPFFMKTGGIVQRHDTEELHSMHSSTRDILQLCIFAKSYRNSK